MRRSTTLIGLLLLGWLDGSTPAIAAPPNIIVILVDDMGFSDLGCYGGEIDTPHIDRLAAEGLRFTQFYNSGRCCPTRASLMTGLHPHQVGIGHMTAPPNKPLGFEGPYQGYLNNNCVTIAEVLKPAGYHTLMTGKWHLGVNRRECWPLQRGFDRYYGCLSGAINYFQPGGDRGVTRGNEPAETDENFYATDAFTDEACEFLTDHLAGPSPDDRGGGLGKDAKPFYLYLAYNAPHWPLNSKWQEFQKYKGKYRGGWPAMMESRLAKQKQIGLFENGVVPAPHKGPDWNALTEQQREDLDSIMAAYAGCIDSIDQNVGKLIERLEQLGQLDNTIIFFLSDNGACQEGGVLGQGSDEMVRNPPLKTVEGVRLGRAWANACNTPLRLYKHFLHEGGACTPMIVHWPSGIDARQNGSFVRQVAYLPDVMATCVALADAKYPADAPACRGVSMLPLLEGDDEPIHREPIYWEHEGNAAMRSGNWKLVRRYGRPWELYDMSVDPTEMNNLAKTQAVRKREMIAQWKAWAVEHEVAFPERFNMYDFLQNRNRRN